MLRQRRSDRAQGFTLIEVMITVAIIAILAAVAIPQYTSYITRSRVPEATSQLATRQVQAEQFYQDNRTYADVGAIRNPGCINDTTSYKYFDFACSGASATGFTLTATGKNAMAGFKYTVTQSGSKTTTVPSTSGWTGSSTCWVTKKDGTC